MVIMLFVAVSYQKQINHILMNVLYLKMNFVKLSGSMLRID